MRARVLTVVGLFASAIVADCSAHPANTHRADQSSSGTTGSTGSTGTTTGSSGTIGTTGGSSGSTGSSGGSSGSTSGNFGSLAAVPLTGCPLAGYVANLTIGGQSFPMTVDTGSTELALATSNCSNCGVSPEYTPNGNCSGSASQSYGSGSWSASICSDVVAISPAPAVTINFAGITSQQSFLNSGSCGSQGMTNIVGNLGLGLLSRDKVGNAANDSYFTELVAQGTPSVFAFLGCASGGTLWFGGYDPTLASAAPQYTPLAAGGYWNVNLQSIGLGSQTFGGADSQTTVDTGTTVISIAPSAYSALTSALGNDPGAASVFGAGTLGTSFFDNIHCATPAGGQTQAQIDAALPPMTLTLPDGTGTPFTLSLPATHSYLVPSTSGTSYCAGLASSGSSATGHTILGTPALRAFITIFDLGDSQIGFAPQSACN